MNQSSVRQDVVFAHIVLHNSITSHGIASIRKCLDSLLHQKEFQAGSNLSVCVTDNASEDREDLKTIMAEYSSVVKFYMNPENLGFCGAHNQAAKLFLESEAAYLLLLNPDLALKEDSLLELAAGLERHSIAGMATPRLYRADSELEPVKPLILDAAGMRMTSSLRHFDIGSGTEDGPKYDGEQLVFGGTGACLLIRRDCVSDLILEASQELDESLYRIYPQLRFECKKREQLFDEAFFAYREDADLSWRAQILGWECIYVGSAKGYHKRVVLPERRAELAPELNLYGVRNRFLLQINNCSLAVSFWTSLSGLIVRNLLVILAVFLIERTSLPALRQVMLLWRRAIFRRKELFSRSKISSKEVGKKWFSA